MRLSDAPRQIGDCFSGMPLAFSRLQRVDGESTIFHVFIVGQLVRVVAGPLRDLRGRLVMRSAAGWYVEFDCFPVGVYVILPEKLLDPDNCW